MLGLPNLKKVCYNWKENGEIKGVVDFYWQGHYQNYYKRDRWDIKL